MKVVTPKEMQALDRQAIDECGIPSLRLMERAGEGVVRVLEHTYGPMRDTRVSIVVGQGNNGGDGLVVGRLLMKRGARVRVHILTDPVTFTGDALTNFTRYRDLGGTFVAPPPSTPRHILQSLEESALIVDAIFGTGLSKPIEGMFAEIIQSINRSRRPIVAIDIPSGLSGDTGTILGSAIHATHTVTLALPKRGLFLDQGITHSGDIAVTDIGIPSSCVDDAMVATRLITGSYVTAHLPHRPRDAHKGTFGHVGIVAGSVGRTGAAVLASQAALRTGAGLVSLATPAGLNDILETMLIEVMTHAIPDISIRAFGAPSVKPLLEFSDKKTAVAIGPGIGTHNETIDVVMKLIPELTMPCVIDADALNAVATDPTILNTVKAPMILTPHPGEMARLLRCTTFDVSRDRFGSATALSQKTGAIVILKGARTLVAAPDHTVGICSTGNPRMATAGTGDVLTGIITGLIGQGLSPHTAASVGVYLHGLAGDIAAAPCHSRSMIASDLVASIPQAITTAGTTATGPLGQHIYDSVHNEIGNMSDHERRITRDHNA